MEVIVQTKSGLAFNYLNDGRYLEAWLLYGEIMSSDSFLAQLYQPNRDLALKKFLASQHGPFLYEGQASFEPDISVIIPLFNKGEYFDQCLESVKAQSLRNIEIIIIDDGSTDDSLGIALRHAMKADNIFIARQSNKGPASARNMGIKLARGEWIAFMDADDFYPESDCLEALYSCAMRSKAQVCGGSLLKVDASGLKLPLEYHERPMAFAGENWLGYADYQYDYGFWRFLYSRAFLLENDLSFPNLRTQEDPIFFVRALDAAGGFCAVPDIVYAYRTGQSKPPATEDDFVAAFESFAWLLNFSKQRGYSELHRRTVTRINEAAFVAKAIKFAHSSNARGAVLEAFKNIDAAIAANIPIHSIYEALREKGADASKAICSIIVPVYNGEKYISRCLESILAQTFRAFELICVNDGSTDATADIISIHMAKDQRVRLLGKPNGGQSSARNLGLKAANGYYVCFADADDWLEQDMLFRLIAGMEAGCDVVNCGANIVFDKSSTNTFIKQKLDKLYGCTNDFTVKVDENVIMDTSCVVWNKLYKTNIIKNCSIYFSEGLIFEDNEFILKYLLNCKSIHNLSHNLYNYYQDPCSTMYSVRECKSHRMQELLAIYRNMHDYVRSRNDAAKYKELLTRKYHGIIGLAYACTHDAEKPAMRETIRRDAASYECSHIDSPILERIKSARYSLVRELNHVVVSLTSYPARINHVHKTVESILRQDFQPDEVVLYLAREQFPNGEADLPCELLELGERGLRINWSADLRSYKKIIPALRDFSNSLIITADDDIIYPVNWLRALYEAYERDDAKIHCHLGHGITFEGTHKISPYKNWKYLKAWGRPSFLNFPIGAGGILYQKKLLHPDVLNEKEMLELAYDTDDIWLWAMEVLAGTPINIIGTDLSQFQEIEECKPSALWRKNKFVNNDLNLQKMLSRYPQLRKIINEAH